MSSDHYSRAWTSHCPTAEIFRGGLIISAAYCACQAYHFLPMASRFAAQ